MQSLTRKRKRASHSQHSKLLTLFPSLFSGSVSVSALTIVFPLPEQEVHGVVCFTSQKPKFCTNQLRPLRHLYRVFVISACTDQEIYTKLQNKKGFNHLAYGRLEHTVLGNCSPVSISVMNSASFKLDSRLMMSSITPSIWLLTRKQNPIN